MDSLEDLIDYPLFALPLPHFLIGYRPIGYFSRNSVFKESDLLFVNDKRSKVFKIVTDIRFDENQKILGNYAFSKDYSDYPKVDYNINHKFDSVSIKRVLSSNESEWTITPTPEIKEFREERDSVVIILSKIDDKMLSKYFREYTILERGDILYESDCDIQKGFMILSEISGSKSDYICNSQLNVLLLNKEDQLIPNGFLKFTRLILGFSVIGPIPLDIARNLYSIIIELMRMLKIENGIKFGNFILLLNKENIVRRKLNKTEVYYIE